MILFATEGNSTIGMGHVVRCLALAHELRRHTDEAIRFHLPEADGVARFQVIAAGFGFDVAGRVVVSDYADGHAYRVGDIHVTLADVESEAEQTDRIIAVFGSGSHSGPRYAILREQFKLARGTAFRTGMILLSFGGADPKNYTEQATKALEHSPYRIATVLGPAYPHADSYIERWGHRVDVHRPGVTLCNSMANLMSRASLLICSGGMTPIEAACVGTPTLVYAQNEREHARMLMWSGHYGIGWFGMTPISRISIDSLMCDPLALQEAGARGMTMVDGQGAYRAAQAVLSLQQVVRLSA
jgi:UDP-2,4-diacetamido-2,4,6-trideoxy-beta-L-altropyranose hydrolase